jgi:hypothetical protein
MTFRILLLAAALGTSAARAEPRECRRDKDCPGDQVCERNACVEPGRANVSREQAASQNAGMALQYTKNTWPTSIVDRPLVVAPGMTEAQLGVSQDLSTDAAVFSTSHPLGADLYARFGVSDRIHAGLDAVAVCLADCGGAGFFRLVSIGAGYAVVANHDMNFVPALTAAVYNLSTASNSAVLLALQPGFLFGWRMSDALQLFASGGFVFGVVGRDNTSSPDALGVHLEPRVVVAPGLSIGPYLGYTLPLAHTDFYMVPLGINALFVVTRAVDVGGTFEFSDVASKTITSPAGFSFSTGGFGARSMRVFATIRL